MPKPRRPITFIHLRPSKEQSFFSRLLSKIQRFFPPAHAIVTPSPARPHISRPRSQASQLRRQRLQPIHLLPPELLSRIFIIAVHLDPSDAMNDYVPFAVSQTCRLWRTIALHAPAIWRRIPLVISTNMEVQEHAIRTRIMRARDCSLDVYLRGYRVARLWAWIKQVPQRLERDSVWRAMRCVVPEMHRWRSFLVESTEYGDTDILSSALGWWADICDYQQRPPVPMLEEMRLVFRENADPMRVWGREAPRLRRLVIEGIRFAWGRPPGTVFGHLTFLDYRHHPFNTETHAAVELLAALRYCPALRELRVLFPFRKSGCLESDERPSSFSFPVPLTHRSLTILQLRVDGPDIPREILVLMQMIQMPALQYLALLDLKQHRQPFSSLRAFRRVCPCVSRVQTYAEYGWTENGGLYTGRR